MTSSEELWAELDRVNLAAVLSDAPPARKTLICGPDNRARIEWFLEQHGCDGMYQVVESQFLPPDTILVVAAGVLSDDDW